MTNRSFFATTIAAALASAVCLAAGQGAGTAALKNPAALKERAPETAGVAEVRHLPRQHQAAGR